MGLLIRNGEIVTAVDQYQADIWCENQTITAIGHQLDAPPDAEVIDASGKYVFPGFIDPHVHIYLPFMGTFAKDTHESASRAALVGGTTAMIEMVCPANTEDHAEALATWMGKDEGQSACDYTFHMGVSRYDAATEAQLREIVAGGIASFKVFLAYKGAFEIDDASLFHTLRLAKELGVKIYVVGVGTPGVDADFNEPLLKRIAEETGGFYGRGSDGEALRQIVRKIDQEEKTEIESVEYSMYVEKFAPWAWAALLALTLEMTMGCTIFRKIP